MRNNSEPEYLTIGTIVSSWGLRGQVKVSVETDFPQRFSTSSRVFINRQVTVIDEATWHKGQAIVKIHGVDTQEDADGLVGHIIEIHQSQFFNLKDGEYFHYQLIGLQVITSDGNSIGTISEILNMASADIYVIRGENGEILIPAIGEIINTIDLDKGIMVIEPTDGLLNLNEKKRKK